MATDIIARGLAVSNSGSGGGSTSVDIQDGVGIEFTGSDPIIINNGGITNVQTGNDSDDNGTIRVTYGKDSKTKSVPVKGLNNAAYKNVDTVIDELTKDSENLPTTKAVKKVLDSKIDSSKLGEANGIATLDEYKKLVSDQLPSHNHGSNEIDAMTNYQKPSTLAEKEIKETDSLNTAIGKLEKNLDDKMDDGNYAGSSTKGGSATSAEKLSNTEQIGTNKKPVYFSADGIPVAIDHTINSDVPENAKFTDTKYSAGIGIRVADDTMYNMGVLSVNESATNGCVDFTVGKNGTETSESKTIPVHGLGDAAYKSVDTVVTKDSANLITSGAVSAELDKKMDSSTRNSANGVAGLDSNSKINVSQIPTTDEYNVGSAYPVTGKAIEAAMNTLPNPMLYKGSLGTGGTITALPTASASNEGFTYKVITSGTYAGQSAKVGDVFISNGTEWTIIPSGDEPEGTVISVGISVPIGLKIKEGTSPVTTSGTIEVQLDEGYVIPKTVDIVPSTRKVNNITLESDIVLDGDDIKTTGYAKAESKSNITGTDTINQALGKLELKSDTNETNISTLIERLANIEKRVTTISHVYGFYIDGKNSNPSTRVTYIEDAIGMKPAFMNYETDKFDYGSWGNAWFMPKPCMLKSDGTVAYYLDPMDYSKKIDGTESDISNDSFDGNAMMEWGTGGKKIWTKTVPVLGDPTSCYKYFADEQIDPDYHAYSFIGVDGKMKDHFYTPIYHGSVVGSKLRSLSGKAPCMSKTAQQEIDLATANGNGWYVEQFCDIELINDLLVLMGKSTDTQTVFGKGNSDGYANDSSINYGMINSGTMNDKGLFWGSNVSSSSARNGVKVFGMENWWGNQWRRFAGLILDSGIYKTKMCYGVSDSSTVKGYNLTSDGYVSSGITPGGTSGGYINITDYSNGMSLPKTASGSSSTYHCDGLWFNNSIVAVAYHGGRCGNGAHCGAFSLAVDDPASDTGWSFGAALSFKSP